MKTIFEIRFNKPILRAMITSWIYRTLVELVQPKQHGPPELLKNVAVSRSVCYLL